MDTVWFMKVIALIIWTVLLLFFYGNRIGFWNLIALVLAFGLALRGGPGSGWILTLLLVVAAVYALRVYDWFIEGFKRRIASRMLWAGALACAFAGFAVYGVKIDPHGTDWPSTLISVLALFAFLMGIVGVVRMIITTPGGGNGKNWRNAGDSGSDPDNYIWSGNPSHDDD